MQEFLGNDIKETATKIATGNEYDDVHELQCIYWLHLRHLIRTHGYSEVQKQLPGISKSLADAVGKASSKAVMKLCYSSMSTLKPSLSDETLINILGNTDQLSPKTITRSLLEILSNESLHPSTGMN